MTQLIIAADNRAIVRLMRAIRLLSLCPATHLTPIHLTPPHLTSVQPSVHYVITTNPMLQRWLSRLSFTFFVVAALCAWEIYNIRQGRRGFVPGWKVASYYVGAIICIALGMVGTKARHRRDDL
jgi:hypothetical protein